MIRLRQARDHADVGRLAADCLDSYLDARPEAHVCLASGNSPRTLFAEIAARAAGGSARYARVRFTQLDEWHRVPRDDPAGCGADLRTHLYGPLGVPPERLLGFDSEVDDPEAEVRRVAALAEGWGPFDVCVLGLGIDGHIGMNEPADALPNAPHAPLLTEAMRGHAMLGRLSEPPTRGMTFGVRQILAASMVLLPVTGESKREALRRMLGGPITTHFPASLLQLHPCCEVVADAAATG